VTAPSDFLFAAAQRRLAANDRTGAQVLLDELLRHSPDHAPALRMLADLQLATSPVAAANAVHRVIQANPDDLEALELLARALSAMGRHDESLRVFQRIAAVKPSHAAAHANLAVALLRAGDPHASIAAAQRAIALDATRPEAHAALGHAQNLLHQSEPAIEAFQKALSLRPNYADALLGVARAHRNLGRPSTAIAALQRGAELAPNLTSLQVDLATVLREFGEGDAAVEALRKAIALSPALPFFYSNLLFDMQYDPNVGEAEAAAEARQWGLRQIAAVRPVALPADRDLDPDRPLRVGYVSADFYRHPVGWLASAPIMAHDRSAVTVVLYANQTSYDRLTETLQRSADAWVPIMGLDDDSVAARIAADRIDILVDLAGHTAGNRLAVFARRPAPIQVTWLGYSATTGLPAMDYMLLDDDHLSPGAEHLMLESVVRLPHVRFCYAPPDYAGEVAEPPSASGRPVTFASFNNSAKLNDAVIALWARVLAAVPHSRLLLKWRSLADPVLQARIRHNFARHGIDGERIRFDGATEHADMLRQYGDADIALDPFPFCGGQTSCEALWMGVPVVTLAGSRPFSRQTHAILRAIGRAEWSAGSADDYVEIAARLAGDPIGLGRIRRGLRQQMLASALCDAPGFARSLERVYRKLWIDHLAGR
jgi:predicted O-linked N-acetylglucosamine transferase (SPINDLY family)